MSDSKGAAIRQQIITILERTPADSQQFMERLPITAEAILAILAQEVKRIIGEDEPTEGAYGIKGAAYQNTNDRIARNKLRKQQRRKAGLV